MESRRYHTKLHFLLLIGLLLSLLIQPRTITAQSVDTETPSVLEEQTDPMVDQYAKWIGISLEEAKRRLNLQNEMDDLERKVIEGEPTYAGSWMTHEPEFGLVVAFTSSDGEEKMRKYLEGIEWANLVKVQQSIYTTAEFLKLFDEVRNAAKETGVPFEASANPRTSKIEIFTPDPDRLQKALTDQGNIPDRINDITLIYQEKLSVFFELKYPVLLGGHPLSECTTGYTVKRNSDNRRFLLTAGHCGNNMSITYGGVDSVYLGPVVYEVDGSAGGSTDIQMHDVSVRSLDLTNTIRNGTLSTAKIVATETKATTLNDVVCKYGKITGYTCGTVTSTTYGGSYVKVERFSGATYDIGCSGDSGAPVFKSVSGGLSALGTISGGTSNICAWGFNNYWFHSPVDEVNNAGFSILTSHYQERYHQNVFFTNGTCTEYRTPYNDNGNATTPITTQTCASSPPGSGTVDTYTAWVSGQYWREAIWQNGKGYTRKVPLNSSGTINWSSAPNWLQCCTNTAPRSQDGFIVGNTFYQNVFWTESSCIEYSRPLDGNGNETGAQTSQPCRTTQYPSGQGLPGSGTITSYTAYVIGERVQEGMWRNGIGYTRLVPLNSTNTDVNWSSAPAWVQCCTGLSTTSQGGDILTYP